jgi:hypothetical protein
MLTQNIFSVGTTPVTVVAPTVDAGRWVLKNLQPTAAAGQLARDGHIYQVSRYFSIANNNSVFFSFTTGDSGAQIEFWKFSSSTSSVLAQLVEGATITTNGTTIPAYNLNRDYSDLYSSTLEGATAIAGGTVILSEYIGGSNQSAGGAATTMPVTLEPNTQYGFRFQDVGGNGTNCHIQLGWAEQYNGYNEIWLGTPNDSFVLRGGEELALTLFPYETINATAGSENCKLAVVRQD